MHTYARTLWPWQVVGTEQTVALPPPSLSLWPWQVVGTGQTVLTPPLFSLWPWQVVGTEQTALASVVAADVELMQLREEEAEINRQEHFFLVFGAIN